MLQKSFQCLLNLEQKNVKTVCNRVKSPVYLVPVNLEHKGLTFNNNMQKDVRCNASKVMNDANSEQ